MKKIPSFSYMGGKVKIRKWLISHFPLGGCKYLEPFAGVGNVFFQARGKLRFEEWHLNDIDASFFRALLSANLDDLPEKVEKEDFEYWKKSGCDVARIIENRITFGGKGYSAGFNGEHEQHVCYNKKRYKRLCERARLFLKDVKISEKSWDAIDYSSLTTDDFVYFDPPYYNTKASYPNIDHEKFISVVNSLECKWAISGYDNELYSKKLQFSDCFERERNSEIKSSNSSKKEVVIEKLWVNYHQDNGYLF